MNHIESRGNGVLLGNTRYPLNLPWLSLCESTPP